MDLLTTKRELEIAVLSDIHLATFGCHSKELVLYLQSINPKILILNGDIIDCWSFSKRYFPTSHFDVLKEIINMLDGGTRVIYLLGNHEDNLRKFGRVELGNLLVTDNLVCELDGKVYWFFHGDAFDATTKGIAIILAKIGGKGYDLLIVLNRVINWFLRVAGWGKVSFSKRIKNSVKNAVKWINNFEETIAELAIEKKYDYVVCGHIHTPAQKVIKTSKGSVVYLNSGDWVENLTSLEYDKGEWKLFTYKN